MKPDTERKKFYTEKIHRKKNRIHAHLSKDLRKKTKTGKRTLSLRKGDKVKVMRGSNKGKQGKVTSVLVKKGRVYVEGVNLKNAKGDEVGFPLDPSNLLLISLESTKQRKELFSADAFSKAEPKKEEKKPEKKGEKEKKTEEPPKAPVPTAREG